MMPKRALRAALLLALCATAGAGAGQTAEQGYWVLDGDTFLIDGEPVRIAGMDAPELGPWARCWAEAALAGHARSYLETLLLGQGRRWRLADMSTPDAQGRRTARVLTDDGFDLADEMVVAGYAAMTDGRWDWCGVGPGLRQVMQDDPPPHGPSLWWPSNHMYDPRAAD